MARTLQNAPRFRVKEFTNPATGSISWRVSGTCRNGERIRENWPTYQEAHARAVELESQWLGIAQLITQRPTHLSPEQLRLAEAAFARLESPGELMRAIDDWLSTGKARRLRPEAPSLDEAVAAFNEWLDSPRCPMRPRTKPTLRSFVAAFAQATGNVNLARITPETVEKALADRWSNPSTQENVRRAVCRFFSWCVERPRTWILTNPASAKIIKKPSIETPEPEVFSLRECARLLIAARRFRDGKFLRFVVLGMFCGLRPTEAVRIRADQVNFEDGEIRVETAQAKTGDPRTVKLPEVALAWLRLCKKDAGTANPQNSRLLWDAMRKKAKLKRWPHDVLRHTAISHYFRSTGSYGLSAEWAGNSEAIIKKHYQGRVTSAQSALFWTFFPTRAERVKARNKANADSKVISLLEAA